MQYAHQLVNIANAAAHGRRADTILEVEHPGLLLDEPVRLGETSNIIWKPTEPGRISVPLVPYLTVDAPHLAMGFVAQLGCAVGLSIPKASDSDRLWILIGQPINEVTDAVRGRALQIYLGFFIEFQ